MSATDFRALVDTHEGEFIGVECVDGVHIDIGISGRTSFQMDVYGCLKFESRIRHALDLTMPSAFDVHAFKIVNGVIVGMNYYELGALLDAVAQARREITG